MIAGLLNNLESSIGKPHSDIILEAISQVNFEKIEFGVWHNLDGHLRVIILNKDNFKQGIFENHKVNQDIHVVLEGEDEILLGESTHATSLQPYDAALDYELFNTNLREGIRLSKGSFVLLETQEIHTNRFLLPHTIKMVFKRIGNG
jgi:YhcH/YjgK/YiaL family protein